MERITQKDLEYLVKRINEVTGSPATPYTATGDKTNSIKGNIGNYHLDYSYNGVGLARMVNCAGGISIISTNSYGTKRELFNWMQAFLAGIAVEQIVD